MWIELIFVLAAAAIFDWAAFTYMMAVIRQFFEVDDDIDYRETLGIRTILLALFAFGIFYARNFLPDLQFVGWLSLVLYFICHFWAYLALARAKRIRTRSHSA